MFYKSFLQDLGSIGLEDQTPPPPYVGMAKSLFCSGKPQNHADKNLKQEVQYGIIQLTIPESFMKFCSAVLEEQWIRDGDGRTNKWMDIRITIYPCKLCGGYNKKGHIIAARSKQQVQWESKKNVDMTKIMKKTSFILSKKDLEKKHRIVKIKMAFQYFI